MVEIFSKRRAKRCYLDSSSFLEAVKEGKSPELLSGEKLIQIRFYAGLSVEEAQESDMFLSEDVPAGWNAFIQKIKPYEKTHELSATQFLSTFKTAEAALQEALNA